MRDKSVVVITSRGGAYPKGTPAELFDFQEPYLGHILGFIGLTNVTFIHAENQLKPEANVAFAAAVEQIADLLAEEPGELLALSAR
jgi:FMN-dependent NADH-azoreductase